MDNTEAVEKLAKVIGDYYETQPEIIAREILAAIQADPLAYVKPKPLVWCAGETKVFPGEDWHSSNRAASYKVMRLDGIDGFSFYIDGVQMSKYITLEAAQAAAYDDLCNRVKELF